MSAEGIEQLRYYNRTCGLKAGPYLSPKGTADSWAVWNVTIPDYSPGNENYLATIKAAYQDGNERCSGYIATRFGSECRDAKAKRATMSETRAETWRLATLADGMSFRIIVPSRSGGCSRFLSVSSACDVKYTRIYTTDVGPRSRWRFSPVATPTARPVLPPELIILPIP